MARRKYRKRKRYKRRKYVKREHCAPDVIGELTWILGKVIWWPFHVLGNQIYMFLWKRWRPQTMGVPSTTLKGEAVKSKAEKRIADFLYINEVAYIYEKPVRVWFGVTKLYPDFYLPEYKVYIEYFGMMKDRKYNASAVWKMNLYKKSRLKVFSLDSSQYHCLESHLENMIQVLKNVSK